MNLDIANAIAVDATGAAYIAGETTSANLAAILVSQNPPTGVFDAFVVKLVPTGDSVAALLTLGAWGGQRHCDRGGCGIEHIPRGMDTIAEPSGGGRLSNDQRRELQRVRGEDEFCHGRSGVGKRHSVGSGSLSFADAAVLADRDEFVQYSGDMVDESERRDDRGRRFIYGAGQALRPSRP